SDLYGDRIIRNADGSIAKLSKRHGSVSFENLTAEGYLPDAIINYIALLGWSPKSEREIFTLPELVEAFNLNGLNKSAAVFDYAKLKWMNGEYVKALPLADFTAQAAPFAQLAGSPLQSHWPEIAELLHTRTALYKDIPEMIEFLRQLPEYSLDLYTHK
ncbi:MAG: glutamate--tRNA ligase family protein, partial [Victivallaceae bacterium]